MDIDKLEELEKRINERLSALLNDVCYDSSGYKTFHKDSILKTYYVEIFKITLDLIKDFKYIKASNKLLRNTNEILLKDTSKYCKKEFDNDIVKRIEDLEYAIDQIRGIK